MAEYYRNLIDGEKFKQCNLDDILYWFDVNELGKHVFKKKVRLFFQGMHKTMAESIYKTFVHRAKYLGDFRKIFTMFCRRLRKIMLST